VEIQKIVFKDSKTNGEIQYILGPALHNMNDFQVIIPLIWSAIIQSLTFNSTQYPLNRRCRLLRGTPISAVGYSVDSSISAVGYCEEMTTCAGGYSDNFESPQ
jgi:hypothetical protein